MATPPCPARQAERGLTGTGSASGTVGPGKEPATISVSYWNGTAFVPVGDPRIEWATGSGQPTRVTFTPVSTNRLRLDLTSRAPRTAKGFLGIAEMSVGRQ